MPSRDAHIAQAEHNEELVHQLMAASQFVDWQITALFYAGLHYTDAYLATRQPPLGIHPRQHLTRTGYLARDHNLRAIERHYLELKDRSEDARYDVVSFSHARLEELRASHFDPLRRHLRSLIGMS